MPALNGGAGGDGADAAVLLESADPDNQADAVGGDGGAGGDGGDNGGNGGDGGAGGDATATLATDILIAAPWGGYTQSSAYGGVGGDGGYAGWGEPLADPGNGGAGGNAKSHVSLSSSGDPNATLYIQSNAFGGAGGNVSSSYSDAGSSTGSAGNGGTAIATAHGTSSTGQRLEISAFQQGGNGGSVLVPAMFTAGNGAHSIMVDAVGGSTAGTLVLSQTAIGGAAGSGSYSWLPALAGDALSSLTASNSGGGDINARVEAMGGAGGGSGTATLNVAGQQDVSAAVHADGDGYGDASANLNAEATGEIYATVHASTERGTATAGMNLLASGGIYGDLSVSAPEGNVSLGPVYAYSTGGATVALSTSLRTRDDLLVENSLSGQTTGDLWLRQTAHSDRGAATSLLTQDGGDSAYVVAATEASSYSGAATARTHAFGDHAVSAESYATASNRSDAYAESAATSRDGAQLADSRATANGGHCAVAGCAAGQGVSVAVGGAATATSRGGNAQANGGRGGAAVADARGQTSSTAWARGGQAGQTGTSGSATAISTTQSSTNNATADATAIGGDYFGYGSSLTRGGDASATATVSENWDGMGSTGADATANATAGRGTTNGTARAVATAEIHGSNYVHAGSHSIANSPDRVRASALASHGEEHEGTARSMTLTTEAAVAEGAAVGALENVVGKGAAVYATALPDTTSSLDALAGNGRASDLFAPQGAPVDVLGIAALGGGGTQSNLTLQWTLDLDPTQTLSLALLDSVVTGAGFDFLQFYIWGYDSSQAQTTLVDQTFWDADAASDFFDDNILSFDAEDWGGYRLMIGFNLSGTSLLDSFAFDMMIGTAVPTTVPLPAAAWLLGSGLFVFVGVSRRRAATRRIA